VENEIGNRGQKAESNSLLAELLLLLLFLPLFLFLPCS